MTFEGLRLRPRYPIIRTWEYHTKLPKRVAPRPNIYMRFIIYKKLMSTKKPGHPIRLRTDVPHNICFLSNTRTLWLSICLLLGTSSAGFLSKKSAGFRLTTIISLGITG